MHRIIPMPKKSTYEIDGQHVTTTWWQWRGLVWAVRKSGGRS